MGKKRKPELHVVDLEQQRDLHASFAAAANSISQLYTQALQQSRHAQIEGARAALDRQVAWLVQNYSHRDSVPLAELLGHLRQEVQTVEYSDKQMHSFATHAPTGLFQQGFAQAQGLAGSEGMHCSPNRRQATAQPQPSLAGLSLQASGLAPRQSMFHHCSPSAQQ